MAHDDNLAPPLLERRLRVLEDEAAIHGLAARFTDCANERDLNGFRNLWTPDAEWEIGPPLPVKARGVDAIVALLAKLLEPKLIFIQMTHSGVIEFSDANTARARFVERERGKGAMDYYENLAIYRDLVVRTNEGWRFQRRYYDYRYLDTAPFPGEVFPSAPAQ